MNVTKKINTIVFMVLVLTTIGVTAEVPAFDESKVTISCPLLGAFSGTDGTSWNFTDPNFEYGSRITFQPIPCSSASVQNCYFVRIVIEDQLILDRLVSRSNPDFEKENGYISFTSQYINQAVDQKTSIWISNKISHPFDPIFKDNFKEYGKLMDKYNKDSNYIQTEPKRGLRAAAFSINVPSLSKITKLQLRNDNYATLQGIEAYVFASSWGANLGCIFLGPNNTAADGYIYPDGRIVK